jgi:hypothetical protein
MELARMFVDWTGTSVVGLARNVLHFDASDSDPDVGAVHDAYFAMRSALPASVVLTIHGSGDVIDDATGDLVRAWSTGPDQTVLGSSTDTSAAGVGACVTWHTGQIVNARRLRGRTFLVPLSTFAYDAQGTLTTAQQTALNAFGTAMVGTTTLGVWHRPTTPGGSDGTSGGVISYTLRDHVAFLGSRRD